MSLIPYGYRRVMETKMGDAIRELVRGQEEKLLERLEPLVRTQSVILDMSDVERIDAAGIAALIRLYCQATQAGHVFSVSHAAPRVEEILHLVGLERILVTQEEGQAHVARMCLELSAA
jgi:anti-anti-sigma factor